MKQSATPIFAPARHAFRRLAIRATMALAAGTASAAAIAADWREIGATDAAGVEHVVLLDMNSVRRLPNGIVAAWIMSSFARPQMQQTDNAIRSYQAKKSFWHYKCSEGAAQPRETVTFESPTADGPVLDFVHMGESFTQFSAVVPDSLGEITLKTVCDVANGSSSEKPVTRQPPARRVGRQAGQACLAPGHRAILVPYVESGKARGDVIRTMPTCANTGRGRYPVPVQIVILGQRP